MDLHLVEVMIFTYQTNQINQVPMQILVYITNIQIILIVHNLGQDSLETVQIIISQQHNTKYIK
jgi:hypothetical protein